MTGIKVTVDTNSKATKEARERLKQDEELAGDRQDGGESPEEIEKHAADAAFDAAAIPRPK